MTSLGWKFRHFFKSIKRGFIVFRASQFGEHKEGGWDGKADYHLYKWRGHYVYVPDYLSWKLEKLSKLETGE